jgi:UDP-glucose 6-dehydrogenase
MADIAMVKPRQRPPVIGQRYVALSFAALAVDVGYEAVGIDLDLSRVNLLRHGCNRLADANAETIWVANRLR